MPILKLHPRQPEGGHTFLDHGVTLRSETVDALIQKIAAYRRVNGLPSGNPEREVELDYTVRYPWLVVDHPRKVQEVCKPTEPENTGLSQWINRMWKQAPKNWVEKEQMDGRAEKCLSCPHHSPMPLISGEDRRRVYLMGRGQIDTRLGHCILHDWACGLAAWMWQPEVLVNSSVCWAKTTK